MVTFQLLQIQNCSSDSMLQIAFTISFLLLTACFYYIQNNLDTVQANIVELRQNLTTKSL